VSAVKLWTSCGVVEGAVRSVRGGGGLGGMNVQGQVAGCCERSNDSDKWRAVVSAVMNHRVCALKYGVFIGYILKRSDDGT
jgi:hypothetical protein